MPFKNRNLHFQGEQKRSSKETGEEEGGDWLTVTSTPKMSILNSLRSCNDVTELLFPVSSPWNFFRCFYLKTPECFD